ncbi:hypothetical protein GCM10010319_60760 [Streptomyces blastmyceticus]|uniref:Uncharacterized protein n=1 Tax=Streptomyces blastmyceticus TaxID=68180 RepID=A0ABN0XWC1_9ACTN
MNAPVAAMEIIHQANKGREGVHFIPMGGKDEISGCDVYENQIAAPVSDPGEGDQEVSRRRLKPAPVLEFRGHVVLPWADAAILKFVEPPVSLRFGQTLTTPRTEMDTDARGAAVVDDQPVLPELRAEVNERIRAGERVGMGVAVPVHVACHLFTAVFSHPLILPAKAA